MRPDYKNFITDNLLTLCKMIKPPIPKVPQLTFSENYPNLLPMSVRDRALVVNRVSTINNEIPNSSAQLHCSATTLSRNRNSFASSNVLTQLMKSARDQSSTATISGFHLPPKKTEDSFAKLLKSWYEYDLDNAVSNKEQKFKNIKQDWIKMDPKAMPSNLSKRKQIVKGIIKPCSKQNKISIE